jgi:crossover junction endodeoxyribonuclease RusA
MPALTTVVPNYVGPVYQSYRFRVRGVPVAKGSMRALMIRGRPALTSTARNLKEWENVIRFQVQEWQGAPLECPVTLMLAFNLPRPKSLPKRAWAYAKPTKRPDLDKLVRAVIDALTGVVYRDDAQVTTIAASKHYATDFVGLEAEVRWKA